MSEGDNALPFSSDIDSCVDESLVLDDLAVLGR